MRALLLTLALCAVPSTAHADAGLDLAKAAIHEAGVDASADEIAALHAVALERCGGSMRCQMRRFFAGRTTRPWALWLQRDGSRPWGWPPGPSWARFAPRWRAVLAAADAVVAGERVHACAMQPQAWGGAVDRARAERLGLIEVDCGSTRNRFYVFPVRP